MKLKNVLCIMALASTCLCGCGGKNKEKQDTKNLLNVDSNVTKPSVSIVGNSVNRNNKTNNDIKDGTKPEENEKVTDKVLALSNKAVNPKYQNSKKVLLTKEDNPSGIKINKAYLEKEIPDEDKNVSIRNITKEEVKHVKYDLSEPSSDEVKANLLKTLKSAIDDRKKALDDEVGDALSDYLAKYFFSSSDKVMDLLVRVDYGWNLDESSLVSYKTNKADTHSFIINLKDKTNTDVTTVIMGEYNEKFNQLRILQVQNTVVGDKIYAIGYIESPGQDQDTTPYQKHEDGEK